MCSFWNVRSVKRGFFCDLDGPGFQGQLEHIWSFVRFLFRPSRFIFCWRILPFLSHIKKKNTFESSKLELMSLVIRIVDFLNSFEADQREGSG